MKNRAFVSVLPAVIIVSILWLSPDLHPEKKKRAYVGSAVCAECHTSETIGSQYDKWLRSPHAKAVLVLKTDGALAIGKKLSIANPAEDLKCLRCHTTGGGRHKKVRDEGVGCETCHGPGEDYGQFSRHVDTISRQSAYETARKNGMYPTLGIKNIKKREKLCLRCHKETRPCFPEDKKDIYRQSISLQVISEMKKGDLTLKHPLIPPFPQY